MGREGHQHIFHHHDGLLQLEGRQQFLRYQDGLLQLEGRRWIPAKGAWGHGIEPQGQDELPADAILSGEPYPALPVTQTQQQGAASRLRHLTASVTLPGQHHGYTPTGRIGDSFPPIRASGVAKEI
ncbi:hypothetical protein D3C85_849310 [compost metagenome]